jgi:hypothetical protein
MPAGAAQRHAEGPAGPDVDGDLAAALARVRRLLDRIEHDPARERECDELIALERHLSDICVALKAREAGQFVREQFAELGRRMGRAERPPVPAARRRPRQPGQHPLMRVVD